MSKKEAIELLESHLNDKAGIYPVKCLAKQALALLKPEGLNSENEILALIQERDNFKVEAKCNMEGWESVSKENTELQAELDEQKKATEQCLILCTVKEDAKLIVKLQEEIEGLRELLRRALPWINNRKPMCNAECLGKCEACKTKKEMAQALRQKD